MERGWVTFNILWGGRQLSDRELTRPVVQRTVGGTTEEPRKEPRTIPGPFSGVPRFSRVACVLACTSMTYTNKSQGGEEFLISRRTRLNPHTQVGWIYIDT